MKESTRGQKGGTIIVSKPIAKNLSQQKTTGTIRDAELIAAQAIITTLEVNL